MELLPILIAGVAAGAILLIFLGLTSRTSVDPVQARLTQLEAEKAAAVARLQKARSQLKRRAVAGYMGSPASPAGTARRAATTPSPSPSTRCWSRISSPAPVPRLHPTSGSPPCFTTRPNMSSAT